MHFYAEHGGLKFMLTSNDRANKNLANNYLEKRDLPIGWISISPAFLDEDFQCCLQCQTVARWGSDTKSTEITILTLALNDGQASLTTGELK